MTNGDESHNERTEKDFRSSGMLRSACWYLFASVLGQQISHSLKSKKNGGQHHPLCIPRHRLG